MKRLVLISGWKASGKDVCAEILIKHFGYKRMAFADNLKDHVANRYNIPRHHFDDRELKESVLAEYPVKNINNDIISHYKLLNGVYFHTPRSLCIEEGNFARSIYPNIWIKQIVEELDKVDEFKIVISDVRFPNEIEAFKCFDTTTIRINRFDFSNSTDSTERSLDKYPFDIIIDNKGTLDQFKANVVNLDL